MMKALTFSDLPFNWAVCCQTDCPLSVRCQRLHSGGVLPLSQQTWPAVNPKQRSSDCLSARLDAAGRPACGKHVSRK